MIDTRSKRASAASLALPFLLGAIAPDGSLVAGDRFHAGHSYSGTSVDDDGYPAPGAVGGMRQVKTFSTTIPTASHAYFDILGGHENTSGSSYPTLSACAATLRNLRIVLNTAPGSGKSWTFTLLKNNVATAMVVVIADAETSGTTSAAVTLAEGDYVELLIAPSAGVADAGCAYLSVDHDSDVAGQSGYTGRCGGGFTGASDTRRTGVFSLPNWTTSAATLVHSIAACAGAITKVFYYQTLIAITGGDTMTLHLWKNGVKQDGSGGTVDTGVVFTSASAAQLSKSFSLAVSPGDRLYIEAVWSGGLSPIFTPAVQFTATTNGESQVCGTTSTLLSSGSGSLFASPYSMRTESSSETLESIVRGAISPFTLKHLFVYVTAAPGAGDSWTWVLRQNGANATDGQTVTISGASDVSGSDTTHSVAFDSDDTISLRHFVTTSGTADTATSSFGMIQVTAVSGSGEIPPGTNPSPGDPIGTLHFAQIVVNGTSYFAAESIIRDPSMSWGGKKAATLTKISRYRRELSREGYKATTFSIEVADPTNIWRGFSATQTLESIYVAIYRCSAPHGTIEGTPFRLVAGLVKPGGFEGQEGYGFRFECVDVLGSFFADPLNQPQVPSKVLTVAEFSTMDPRFDGRVAQKALGLLTEDGVGVVPGVYMGQLNPSVTFNPAGVNAKYHVLLLSEGAVYDIPMLYITPLTWGPKQAVAANQFVRPTPNNDDPGADYLFISTNSGTTHDTTEPTWPNTGTVNDNGITWQLVGLDDPTIRFAVPASQYTGGTEFTHSKASNWTTVTGLPASGYVDWMGRRYVIALLKSTHHYAKALEEGRIVPLFDIIGATTQNDGDGPPILDPGYLYVNLLLNYLFEQATFLDEPTIPTLPGLDGESPYTVIDVDSADDAKAIADAEGGYKMGRLLGANGNPEDLWQVLADLLKFGALEVGPNRHGQLHFSRRNNTASATVTFTPQRDYRSISYRVDSQRRYTRANWRYGLRYADIFPPVSTALAGDPSDTGILKPVRGQWASGQLVSVVTAAETALGTAFGQARRKVLELDNTWTRDATTAQRVMLRELDYGAGPSPSYHGTLIATITGPDVRLFVREDDNGDILELGSVFAIDDPQGMSSTGFTAKTFRLIGIDHDPEKYDVTLIGEALDATEVTVTTE